MSSSALLRRPYGEPSRVEARGGFGDLDALLVDAQTLSGVIVLRAPNEARGALLAHVGRRLRAAGWTAIDVMPRSPCSAFREAGIQLGVDANPCEASEYATALAAACSEISGRRIRRFAILMPLPAEGTWDEAVAHELGGHPNVLLAFTAPPSTAAPASATATFDIGEELSAPDKASWFAAMAHEAEALVRTNRLRNLEEWWQSMTRESAEPHASRRVFTPVASRALECLALVRRSVPLDAAEDVLGDDVVTELVRARAVVQRANVVVLEPTLDLGALERGASIEARKLALELLLGGTFDGDPWALARASELLVAEGRALEGDETIAKAFRRARDGRIAAEISDAWFASVARVTGESGIEIRLRAADRALAGGNTHDAQRWCESAASADPGNPRVRLATARAHAQAGDLVAARVVLEQLAAAAADDDELRASIAVEQGEIRYVGGQLDAAVREAEQAIDLTTSPHTRLGARSIVGKVLLARGAWDEADAHFAADTLSAHAAGEARAELRARLNRSIVLIAKGLHAEARETLTRVLADGERLGEHRACALALSNLGVVAYHQHDYVGALSFWERTLRYRDVLGGRLAAAMPIANLAELRLRLGLVDNAEHAILFGRSFLSGSITPARSAHFKLVAAQVALARAHTDVALREVESAMTLARTSGDIEYVGAAAIVGARIALADGDVQRAEDWMKTAAEHAKTARSVAELAMLRATHLRAHGRPALAAALTALELARTANEDDLLLDVHALVAASARDEGDRETAQLHCSRALAIRDRVTATLPPEIRAAFVAKPEMVSLDRVRASLSVTHNPDAETPSMRPPPSVDVRPSRASLELVGASPSMRSLLLSITKAARSESTILIHGESGTGKELVARALHAASSRSNGPLVVVNCAALVETLLLSELFGHEKGAFTGATTRKRGRFEIAEGGTLFLDEIGDISPRTQVALLRVLQERTFERVGGTTSIRTSARVICATHRDLRAMVERGEFREDLFYRICGITLEVPPLRARMGDVPRITEHLLERIAVETGGERKMLSAEAMELLLRHSWPGNVRELENVLRSAAVFTDDAVISASDLVELARGGAGRSDAVRMAPPDADDVDDANGGVVSSREDVTVAAYLEVRQGRVSLHDLKRQIERECIQRALFDAKGNITRAAALLGMKRPRLSQLVKQYGFSVASSEEGQ